MRFHLRAASLLALAAAVLSCTDSPTAPGAGGRGASRAARLSVSPSFSPVAARALASLTTLGVQLTSVRVRLVDGANVVVKDTTIDFPADQDTLTVSLPLQITGVEQSFGATIDLRDANGVVFFSSTQQVTARDASLPAAPAPVIVLQFVGPGATARTMTLTPATATIAPSTTPILTASALDANGHAVTNLLVASWTSSDTSIATIATTNDTSATVHGTGKRGAVAFTATTLGGVTATAQLNFLPQPGQLSIVGGAAQTGPAGHQLPQPFAVQLLGVDGLGIADQPVTFRAVTAGGQVGTITAVTDPAGKAQTAITPGKTPGTFVFDATSVALTATVQATAVTGAPSQLVVTRPFPAALTVGASPALSFLGQISDDMGNAVAQANIVVNAAVTVAPSGRSYSATASSDASGVVTINLPAYVGPIGTAAVALTSPALGAISTTSIPMNAGPAAALQIVQQPAATAASGAPLSVAPIVQLADVGGNAVGGAVTLTASLVESTGALSGTTQHAPDASGRASFDGLTITGPTGAYTLRFTSGTLAAATTNLIAVGPGAATQLVATTALTQTGTVGSPASMSPAVRALDAAGNSVPGVSVSFAPSSGSTVNGGSGADVVVTDASGSAAARSWTFGTAARSYSIDASASGIGGGPIHFVADAAAAAPSRLIVTPSTTNASAGQTLSVTAQLVDRYDNVVPSNAHTVTWSVSPAGSGGFSPATAPTDANGLATTTYTAPSIAPAMVTVTATESTISGSSAPISVNAGSPAMLGLVWSTPASTAAGAPFATQPVAQVRDINGNAVMVPGVQVSATVASGPTGATLIAATATTNAQGQASFANLTLGGSAGAYTLSFAATGYTSIASSSLQIVAGAARAVNAIAGDGQTAAPGTAVATVPSVAVKDQYGNAVSGVAVTFSTVDAGASVSDGTTAAQSITVSSSATGIASVASWTLGTTAGPQSLHAATTPALSGSPVAFGATAVATTPTKLGIFVAPSTTAASGAPLATQPEIVLLDANGNRVAQAGVSVSAVLATGGGGNGSERQNLAITDATGKATFTSLTLLGTAGPATIRFDATGLTSVTSTTITLTAGAPTALAVVTQPPSAAQSGIPFSQQPAVALHDGSGNIVAQSGIVVTASIASGSGSISSATATTGADGVARFSALAVTGIAGNVSLSFAASGVTAVSSSPVSISAGAAASITILEGTPQAALSRAVVPIAPKVAVHDAAGNPVAGVAVVFAAGATNDSVAAGGAFTRSATVTTTAAGEAALTAWKLGAAGYDTVTATVGGVATPAVFVATDSIGPATHFVVVHGADQTAIVTSRLADSVVFEARDDAENPVANVPVAVNGTGDQGGIMMFGRASCGGDCIPAPTYTDATGRAWFLWFMSNRAKVDSLAVENEELPAVPVFATALAGPATQLVFVPPTTGLDDDLGNKLDAFTVYATDIGGVDTLTTFSTPVTLCAALASDAMSTDAGTRCEASGYFNGTKTVTPVNGIATFSDIATTLAGSFVFNMSAAELTVQSPAFDIAPMTQTFVVVSGDNQTGIGNTDLQPIVIRSQSGSGRVLPNVPIIVDGGYSNGTWSLAGGVAPGGQRDSAMTDANGLITLTWHLPAGQQSNLAISAHNYDGASATITANAVIGPPAQMQLSIDGTLDNGALNVLTSPWVSIQDAGGNPITAPTDVTVKLVGGDPRALLGGTLRRTSGDGTARFDDLWIDLPGTDYQLVFSSPGLPDVGSDKFTISSATPVALMNFSTPPSDGFVNTVLNPVQVTVRDSYERILPNRQVTISLASGTATLGGTLTVTADANGVATFSDLTIDAVGTYTLSAKSGDVVITSGPFNITTPVSY